MEFPSKWKQHCQSREKPVGNSRYMKKKHQLIRENCRLNFHKSIQTVINKLIFASSFFVFPNLASTLMQGSMRWPFWDLRIPSCVLLPLLPSAPDIWDSSSKHLPAKIAALRRGYLSRLSSLVRAIVSRLFSRLSVLESHCPLVLHPVWAPPLISFALFWTLRSPALWKPSTRRFEQLFPQPLTSIHPAQLGNNVHQDQDGWSRGSVNRRSGPSMLRLVLVSVPPLVQENFDLKGTHEKLPGCSNRCQSSLLAGTLLQFCSPPTSSSLQLSLSSLP